MRKGFMLMLNPFFYSLFSGMAFHGLQVLTGPIENRNFEKVYDYLVNRIKNNNLKLWEVLNYL